MMVHMTAFDAAVVGFVLFVGLKGVFNGLWKEMFGLAGLSVGLLLASKWSWNTGHWIMERLYPIESPSGESLVGFITIVFSSWLLFLIVGVYLFHVKEMRIRGAWDRLFGFLFASVKIFLIVAVAVFAFSRIEFVATNMKKYVEHAVVFPYMVQVGAFVLEPTRSAVVPSALSMKRRLANPVSRQKESNESR